MKKYIWLSIGLGLLLIGTLFDWEISLLANQLNDNLIIYNFYRFFEIFGGFACMLIPTVSFGFFANFGYRKHGKYKWLQFIGCSIGLLVFASLEVGSFGLYLFPEGGNSNGEITVTLVIISLILGSILGFAIFKLFNRISDKEYNYYRKIAIVSFVYIGLISVVITGLKYGWARPRFWIIENGDATFMPWYIINGNGITDVTNGFKSFPSGHTANSFASLFLILWLPRKKYLLPLFFTWGVLTGISRVFALQHFLTDVLAGGIIAIAIWLVVLKLFKLDWRNLKTV